MAITGEYSFFTINDMSRSSSARIDFGSYITAGAGVAFYYPHAQYNNKWYSLRPLMTEGTENAYNEMTLVVSYWSWCSFYI